MTHLFVKIKILTLTDVRFDIDQSPKPTSNRLRKSRLFEKVADWKEDENEIDKM